MNTTGRSITYQGTEYTSLRSLCDAQGIAYTTFMHYIASKKLTEEVLSEVITYCKNCKNRFLAPNGKRYPSRADYCREIGLEPRVVTKRIEDGSKDPYTKEAWNGRFVTKDHLGNVYGSDKEKCEHYGIDVHIYHRRVKNLGWSEEKALTTSARGSEYKYDDEMGHKFRTKKEMCRYHGVEPTTYNRRRKCGKSIKEALNPRREKERGRCFDHKGNEFPTKTEMAQHYGMRLNSLNKGLKSGKSLQEVLECHKKRKIESIDHLGNIYPSKAKMCKQYKISIGCFDKRIESGMSLEEALTTPVMQFEKAEDRIGRKTMANCGLEATITGLSKNTDGLTVYTVEFEDGSVIDKIRYNNFQKRNIRHPTLNMHGSGSLGVFATMFICKDSEGKKVFYRCECGICGLKEIMTPQEILAHERFAHKIR